MNGRDLESGSRLHQRQRRWGVKGHHFEFGFELYARCVAVGHHVALRMGSDGTADLDYLLPMENMLLALPSESLVGVRIPLKELHDELRRRLAAALFTDGILAGAPACRMAGMGKAEFQHMLGERGISQPLDEADYEQDVSNLAAWNAH